MVALESFIALLQDLSKQVSKPLLKDGFNLFQELMLCYDMQEQ